MSVTAGSMVGESIHLTETGKGRFQVEAKGGTATFLIDEPVDFGGLGSGPNPFDLLSAALGSCTLMTIRMYARRKNWSLTTVRVQVTHSRADLTAKDVFTREIFLEGELDDAQRQGLAQVADKCPVHLTLQRGSEVVTAFTGAKVASTPVQADCQHVPGMEEACS